MPFLIYIACYLVFSYVVAKVGHNRKFGFWGYLFASLLLSPVIGCLLVVASDPIAPPEPAESAPGATPETK